MSLTLPNSAEPPSNREFDPQHSDLHLSPADMDLSAFEGATVTLQDVLDTQARLEKEAAELDLGDLDRASGHPRSLLTALGCTHDDGHKTQVRAATMDGD